MAHLAAHRLISWRYFDSERFIVTRSCLGFHRTQPKESTRTISFGRYMYTLAILSVLIRIATSWKRTSYFLSRETRKFLRCWNDRYCDRMGVLACDSRCGLSSPFRYGMWWFNAGKVSDFASSLGSLMGTWVLRRVRCHGFWCGNSPNRWYYRTARNPNQCTEKA